MAAITIIGTGNMAKGIAQVALHAGYEVAFHSRQPAEHEAELKALPGATGNNVTLVPYGNEVTSELAVLAVPYAALDECATSYAEKLAGKVVVDISNPIDWRALKLTQPAEGSAAEMVAKRAPQARVVKAFNTINASLFGTGKAGGLPLDVFIAGDDQAAKQALITLVNASGLRGIDSGPLVNAREIESLEHLFVNMQGIEPGSAIKVVHD